MTFPSITRFGPDGRCHGVLHLPDGQPRGGFVMCPPFGEEAKCAYRTMYELACLAAERGWAVLRFDYFGTGNSTGGFEDFAPSRALEDVRSAIARLRQDCPGPIGALGLGLGAALALDAAAQAPSPTAPAAPQFLILWQPLINGEEFYKLNIKRQLVRQMLTHGKARARSAAATASGPADARPAQDDIIDLDGYGLRKTAANQLKAINLLVPPRANLPATLLLQISYTTAPASDIQALAGSTTPPLTTQAVVCEPFWKRIGFVNAAPVFDTTLEWLERL